VRFKITLGGKDNVAEGLIKATREKLRRDDIKVKDADDPEFEAAYRKLKKLVGHYVNDDDDGADCVTLEFCTTFGTASVVPRRKKRGK
jgi:hypothetical protein